MTVEVHNDVAQRRCPITRHEAQAMIGDVKGDACLDRMKVYKFCVRVLDSRDILIEWVVLGQSIIESLCEVPDAQPSIVTSGGEGAL